MNITFGYILPNSTDGEYRFYSSSNNTTVFPNPRLVQESGQFKMMKQDNSNTKYAEEFQKTFETVQNGPTFFFLTIVLLHANQLSRLPMDAADDLDSIISSGSVWTLEIKASTKGKYNDNLCVFRAIAPSQMEKSSPGTKKDVVVQIIHAWAPRKNCRFYRNRTN